MVGFYLPVIRNLLCLSLFNMRNIWKKPEMFEYIFEDNKQKGWLTSKCYGRKADGQCNLFSKDDTVVWTNIRAQAGKPLGKMLHISLIFGI